MAVELVTCECGQEWIRKLLPGVDVDSTACAECSGTGQGEPQPRTLAPRPGRRSNDPDLPVARAAVPSRDAGQGSSREEAIIRLTSLSGVGIKLAARVMARYATTEELAEARLDELRTVRGVGWTTARRIRNIARETAPEGGLESSAENKSVDLASSSEPLGLVACLSELGPTRAARVLDRYPSAVELAEASVDEVTAIPGVGARTAERICKVAQELSRKDATSREAQRVTQGTGHDEDEGAPRATGDLDIHSLLVLTCQVCDRRYLGLPDDRRWWLCPRCDTGEELGGKHGFTLGQRGCRCDVCLEALTEARVWVRSRLAGESLQTLGDRAGCSRERIRQVTERLEPSKPWDAAARAERWEKDAVAALVAVTREKMRSEGAPCPVCGTTVFATYRRFCSEGCRDRYEAVRYHIDPERREQHRRLMSRWTLENSDTAPDFQVRHARRVLQGTAGTHDDRRWMIEGSEPFRVAVEVFVNGWPLAEEFPEPIREQIHEHLGVSKRRDDPGF